MSDQKDAKMGDAGIAKSSKDEKGIAGINPDEPSSSAAAAAGYVDAKGMADKAIADAKERANSPKEASREILVTDIETYRVDPEGAKKYKLPLHAARLAPTLYGQFDDPDQKVGTIFAPARMVPGIVAYLIRHDGVTPKKGTRPMPSTNLRDCGFSEDDVKYADSLWDSAAEKEGKYGHRPEAALLFQEVFRTDIPALIDLLVFKFCSLVKGRTMEEACPIIFAGGWVADVDPATGKFATQTKPNPTTGKMETTRVEKYYPPGPTTYPEFKRAVDALHKVTQSKGSSGSGGGGGGGGSGRPLKKGGAGGRDPSAAAGSGGIQKHLQSIKKEPMSDDGGGDSDVEFLGSGIAGGSATPADYAAAAERARRAEALRKIDAERDAARALVEQGRAVEAAAAERKLQASMAAEAAYEADRTARFADARRRAQEAKEDADRKNPTLDVQRAALSRSSAAAEAALERTNLRRALEESRRLAAAQAAAASASSSSAAAAATSIPKAGPRKK